LRAVRELTRRVRAFAGRFLESTSGNTAMIFGLVSITVIMAGGAAVDVARAVSMKTRLSSALDAAALAVGTQLDLDEMELEEMAQKYFDANYPASALGSAGAVVLDQNGEHISLSVTGTVDTMLLRIININQFDLNVTNEVTRAANNLEVALALDITGSMKGQQLTDLITASKDMVDMIVQDVQTPYYTKLAIAPYAAAVNVGSYAASIRGSIAAALTITDVGWQTGVTKAITAATKANPAVITSAGHGFVTGDKIWIHSVVGMTSLNNKPYIVGTTTANTFQLKNYNNNNVDSTGYSAYTSGGTIRKCLINTVGVNGCELRVTSAGHGFVNGDRVVIKNVTGTGVTAANNDTTDTNDSNDADGKRATWSIFNVTADTFDVAANMPSGTASGSLWSYTSGGSLYCSNQGCEYHRFTSQGGPTKVFQISTCVSDRSGSEAFTDAAPSTALLARVYPASPNPPASATNPCVGQTIMPLSTNKVALKAQIDSFTAAGSTAGQLGTAWGWYLLSPNFSYLWPSESQPAAYGTDHLYKIFVLMTDGEFNTVYCNDVISQSSTSGSGSSNDHKNCNAPNGSGFANAQALCDAMKAPGKDIIIYTVGFNIGSDPNAQAIMSYCATDAEHEYYPTTGAELQTTFQAIAQEISQLRLSQ
jgi:Flp pilus assembly protein TadG